MRKKIENRISHLQNELEHYQMKWGELEVCNEDSSDCEKGVNDLRVRILECEYLLKILTE